ncbi:GH92 family glycosyl hydrolase [Vibrio gallicus]|uniref:GH92 family glycosyl hydrolase n=1 Tax=Vibrio gallicus TaxID=190897 RepID=UPI0021C39BE7|nr:GH92 family glycosyl hydrolase [Vibrio gallicus]
MKHNFNLLSFSILIAVGGLTACNDNGGGHATRTASTPDAIQVTPTLNQPSKVDTITAQTQGSALLQTKDLTQYVDPFIGTAKTGHTHPGAIAPNGMVQMTPITDDEGQDWWAVCSGYHNNYTALVGFGHTALSGTGIGGLNNFQMLPFTSESMPEGTHIATYRPHMDKSTEEASPGYYHVKIQEGDIDVKLTATERVGYHQYTFPDGENKKVSLVLNSFNKSSSSHQIDVVDSRTVRVQQTIRSFGTRDQTTYFYVKFDHDFKDAPKFEKGGSSWRHPDDGALVLDFNTNSDSVNQHVINAKVGISYASPEGAEHNFDTDGTRTFDEALAYVKDEWNQKLNEIKVAGGTKDELVTFYTALYHTNVAPHIFQDSDGQYRTMRRGDFSEVKDGSLNSPVFSVYSLWDTFRALHPLKTIIEPKHAVDLAKDLIRKYQEGGILPKWELHGDYTGTMVGYPAVAVIADALTKFPEQFSEEEKASALEAALRSSNYVSFDDVSKIDSGWNQSTYDKVHNKQVKYVDGSQLVDGTPATEECDPLASAKDSMCGFVPAVGRADGNTESVSFGLEMANFDHAIANIAKVVHDDDVVKTYQRRAQYWHKYWNASNPDNPAENWEEKYNMTGFMRPIWSDGEWSKSTSDDTFHPYKTVHQTGDYTEGTAWQWTWFVPEDVEGLKQVMGGNDGFLSNLKEVFSNECQSENPNECSKTGDMTGMIGQVVFGNEPSHHIPFLYNWTSEPWHTQEVVDQIQNTLYGTDRGDISGNEDVGQMSAWYVMSAMGLYQVSGSDPVLTIARPIFDKVQIPMGDGEFTITADNNSVDNKYIRSVTINGKQLNKNFTFDFSEFKAGGTLHFVMTNDITQAMTPAQLKG